MALPANPERVYEACLVELHKSMRAASFYALDHPALGQSVDRTLRYFQNLLRVTEKIEFTISKTQVFVGDKPLTGQPQVLTSLAAELFRRRMKKLIFLPGIEPKDVIAFLSAVKMDLDTLAEKGGMESALARFGSRCIFANEVDFNKLEEVAQEEEEEEEEEVEFNLTPEQKALRDLLQQMLRSDEAEFMRLLKEVVDRCADLAAAGQHAEIGVAIDYLYKYTADNRKSLTTREFAERAIRALATKEVLFVKIDELSRGTEEERRRLSLLFQYIGKITVPFLMASLATAEDRVARRNLTRTIVDFGAKALPRAIETLNDERWFVKRNVLAIIAEIGTANEIAPIMALVAHEDERVAREAVKTLGRLGGDAGLQAVLAHFLTLAPAAQLQATTLFGSRKWLESREKLEFVALSKKSPDEVRVASLDALGRLNAPESYPVLAKIFRRKGFFQRAKRLPLRRAALRALVNYGSEAEPLLKKAADDSDEEIQSIARAALDRAAGEATGEPHEVGSD